MKRILFCLLSLALSAQVFGQSLLKGVVLYQNSGGKPAEGVEISAFGATTVSTKDGGKFALSFGAKNPGDKVKIIVGGTMDLIITRPALDNALKEMNFDLEKPTRQQMRSLVCAQCHMEYYFKGEDKAFTFPWSRGLPVEDVSG